MGQVMLYVPMGVGSLAIMLMLLRPGAGKLAYIGVVLMVFSVLGMAIVPFLRTAADQKENAHGDRRDFLRYLSQQRRRVRESLLQQHLAARWAHPDPDGLWSMALSQRLWERRPAHEDFGDVRVGKGSRRSSTRLVSPQTKPVEDLEPLAAHALRRFLRAYTTLEQAPIAVYLRGFSIIQFEGDRVAIRSLARAMLAQATVAHGPADLRVVVWHDEEGESEWGWAKWLPHAQEDEITDAAGARRLFARDMSEAERLLGDLGVPQRPGFEPDTPVTGTEPLVVLILDGARLPDDHRLAVEGYRNTLLLDVGGTLAWQSRPNTLYLQVAEESVDLVSFDHMGKPQSSKLCRPDTMTVGRADALARLMSRYRIGQVIDAEEPLATDYDLASLLGIDNLVNFDPIAYRAGRPPRQRLRVPIGISTAGTPVEIDIKESAENGMGPHGMLIGATGSGKSELLRTLVLALATRHTSEDLNFILVDFKGGAAFLGFEKLPHTSAVITNLADELELVDRMQDAVTGELIRRQEHLRASGNYASRRDYQAARMQGTRLEPMPALFIVVDEFSELLTNKPQFIEVFAMIGRLGRSLGVHLLLASQRIDEGRIHQIESHLSYRIGLRTFSAMESRSVLGVPDAYELPNVPGNGYLRPDTTSLVRFKAAYSSGPYRPARRSRRDSADAGLVPFAPAYVAPERNDKPEPEEPEEKAPLQVDLLLNRLRGIGPAAHQVWLPPLTEPSTLEKLLPPLVDDPTFGPRPIGGLSVGKLQVPLGLIDVPAQQRRELLQANLSGAQGNVGIVGAPQSGKSTLVRTLITGLALTHSAQEVQFYCLDFGGGTLASLARLPHVGSVANRLDRDRVTRTVLEMSNLLAMRENLFSINNIDSMTSFRRAKRSGSLKDQDPFGDVFLIIDGWYTVKQDFEELDARFSEIAARGLGFGIHLVVTATRWSEMRPWLRDVLGTKLELRLGDPIDSEINSKLAATVPARPGRGITTDRLHFLGALPRIDGETGTEDLSTATAELVAALNIPAAPRAPEVRLLPGILPAAALPGPRSARPTADMALPIGLDDIKLSPLWHDFEDNPHLLIFGDAETGKTNILRHIARGVAQHYRPDQARIIFGDFRRQLYDVVPSEYQIGYSVSADALSETIKEAAAHLKARIPGPDITPDRLPKRDWWTGGRLFIIVDDFELIEGSSDHPLQPLVPLLAQGADIGLHLVTARRTAGASRAMTNQTIRRMWELGSAALLFSCPRDEGAFLGNLKPRTLPVGRAQHVDRRRAVRLVQTPMVSPTE
jgi:S-DNA-T family DNA segregation ATPase FtsK/SpoIIIE